MNRSRAKILSVAFVLLATLSITGPAVAANGRPFIWPTTGRITQPYGCTGFIAEPRLGSCRHFHGGIDIANGRGTPIRAAAAGVVTHVGWDIWGTHAWMVMINHGGGVSTWYAHMRGKQIPGLHKGTRVRQGQVIGYMDATGNATGVHLHWAIVKNGHYVNPKSYRRRPAVQAAVEWLTDQRGLVRRRVDRQRRRRGHRRGPARARTAREAATPPAPLDALGDGCRHAAW